jgi:cis-3-alkyl-4-acyloxetan-2-one decarboxylase
LQNEYPFQSHFYDLNGLRYHYLDEGQGDPILMLHGNPTWSFYYRDAVKGLRESYRCIVPDHIGMGYSDKPDDSRYTYTLRQRVDDLENFLEGIGLTENLTILAHDWGGMIGMGYAIRHPERVKRLILLNTAAFHLPSDKPLPWMLRLVRDTRLGAWSVLQLNSFARGAAWVACTRRRMSAALREMYCSPYDSPANRLATLRFVQDIPLHPGDPAYDVVSATQTALSRGTFQNIPVMIGWGMRDFVFDHVILREWKRYLPQAEVHEFADCGHYILEDAGSELITKIQQFLKSHSLEI